MSNLNKRETVIVDNTRCLKMINLKNEVIDKIKKYGEKDIIIYTHADHDGICASVGLTYLFGSAEVRFSRPFKPKELPYLKNKKLFIICDLQLSEKQILYLLSQGLEVINFDHHEIRDIKHENYLCLNPKKIYEKQFISSSGLIWKIFKPEKIAWLLAVGSAGDLCVEDNLDLFEFLMQNSSEFINSISLEKIYSSKIFELAQTLLMSFDNPEEGFKIAEESVKRGYKTIYNH